MDADEELANRLRAVFDLCDTEGRGYISVDYFVDLAKEHFGSVDGAASQEAIDEIVSILDSDGSGKIDFDDFCKGVRHFQGPLTPSSGGQGQSMFSFPIGRSEEESLGSFKGTATSSYLQQQQQRQKQQPNVHVYDGYEMDDDNSPALVDSHLCLHSGSSEDDVDSGFSSKSNDHFDHHDRWSEGTEKEVPLSYEYDDSMDDVTSYHHQRYGGVGGTAKSVLDSSGKCVTPLSYHNQSGNVKRLTPSAIASQLYRGNSSLNTSRRSSISDGLFEEMDGSFIEMNDKIKRLEDQIKDLSETQTRNDDKHSRMKEENSALVERVHLLEEQLREIEQRSQEQLTDEQKKHRDILERTDKDKSREIEILTNSLQHIEREYSQLREEVPALRGENDRLRRENSHLEKETSKLNQQLSELTEEHAALQEHVQTEQTRSVHEHKIHTQLIDELGKELDELRQYRADAHLRSSPAVSADLPRGLRKEMEAQISRLKQENRNLREELEDLRAQLISCHVQEGRSLLKEAETSLAKEFEKLPRDELMKALQKEQEDNKKLRDYVDLITLRILEKNPSILEVSSRKK